MEKKKISIAFSDFSRDFDMLHNDFVEALEKYYEIEISDHPDYLFYSVFGSEHLKYDCIKIFYTGECVVPDFNLCDYAIGFEYMAYEDRYIRIPLYRLFQYRKNLQLLESRDQDIYPNRKFCSFVCSNDQGMPERAQMFELLSKYKRVDSGGKYLNNVGGRVDSKLEFDRNYKFSLAFENCVANGYTTEKILDAFAAGTIPVYFGDPLIEREINPEAFINCKAFPTLEKAVERVIDIDNDDALYRHMRSVPVFKNGMPTNEDLEKFLLPIVQQPLTSARRRPRNTRITEIEQHAKLIAIYEKKIGKNLKRIKSAVRRIKKGAS